MRWIAVICVTVGLAAAQDETPTFRTGARLVEVTVSVTGRDGQPVAGLRREDFTVTDRRRQREIAFFQYEGEAQTPAPRLLAPGQFSNRTELLGDRSRNVIALLIDGLNTRPEDQALVRLQLLQYLRDVAPATRIAIYGLGTDLTVLHDFTTDATALRQAIEKTLPQQPLQLETDIQRAAIEAGRLLDALAWSPIAVRMMTLFQRGRIEAAQNANAAAQQDRTQRTLGALESLGRHLTGIPGRKSLLWITGGLPMGTMTGAAGQGPGGNIESFEGRITSTGRRLAQQNVALYIVEAGGLPVDGTFNMEAIQESSAPRRRTFYSQAETTRDITNPRSALGALAALTGGRHLANDNDRLQGYRYALNDLRGAYTLGFYIPDEDSERWHDVRVQVKRPGVSLLHRQGYWPAPAGPPRRKWTRDDWNAVLREPLQSSQIRFTARATRAGGEISLALAIQAADLKLQDGAGGFDICIADEADGEFRPEFQTGRFRLNAEQLARAYAQGLGYQRKWTPPAGTQRIRVVVRDQATGLYGSLDLPVTEIPGN
ncbi:MAG: VWA domain-containing protein [Bryobacteraceae bacterium]|nr:VWA domain-containing protein [Bryobacteraceae bacterium]